MYDLLREELRRFISRDTLFLARVKSVDRSNDVVTVALLEDENILIEDVLLKAQPNVDGVVYYPVPESVVVVAKLDNIDRYFISMYSEIEAVKWCVGGRERLRIEPDRIVLNEGSKGPLVEINKLKGRLNALEQAFNSLLNHYKTHNHLHPNGNTTGFVSPPTQNEVSQTGIDDLSNEEIEQ